MKPQDIRQKLETLTDEQITALLELVSAGKKYEAAEQTPKPHPTPTDKELQNREKARKATELVKQKISRTDKAGRLKHMRQHKERTPLKLAEHQFLGEQRARGNSEATVKGYGRVFKKLCLFVAYMYGEADGKRIWDTDKTEEELVNEAVIKIYEDSLKWGN